MDDYTAAKPSPRIDVEAMLQSLRDSSAVAVVYDQPVLEYSMIRNTENNCDLRKLGIKNLPPDDYGVSLQYGSIYTKPVIICFCLST